jgi:hypothetical protein
MAREACRFGARGTQAPLYGAGRTRTPPWAHGRSGRTAVRGLWHTGPALRVFYGAGGTRTPPRAHGRSGLVAHGPRSTGLGAHAPHTERTIPGQTTATHPKVWAECRIHGFHFSRAWSGMCRNMPIWNRSERSPHFPWRWEIGPPGPFFRAAPLPLSLRRTGAPERASYQAKARRRPTYPHMRSLEIAVRKGFTGTSRPFI